MSDNARLFIRSGETVGVVARWLCGALGLERAAGAGDAEVGLRGRAVTVDDGWLGFIVRPNGYADVDPGPEDVQAMDGYPVEVDIRFGGRDDDVLKAEGKAAFERVVAVRPDLAVLLCHNLSLLVAAYLPGVGIKYFGPGTTPDAQDEGTWGPWVRG